MTSPARGEVISAAALSSRRPGGRAGVVTALVGPLATPRGTPLRAGVVASAATVVAAGVIERFDLSGWSGWRRTNYRGRSVTLSGGVAAAAGATLAAAACAPPRWRRAAVIAGTSAALAGGYDDLVAPRLERAGDKGWRGHVAALRAGRPSGGVVKVAVIGTGAVLAGRTVTRSWPAAVPGAVLIAGTANLVNLFDLRPGRAGKVVTLLAAAQLGGPLGGVSGAVAGAALAELPGDLGERRMLGDVGANTLGALLGLRLAANGPASRWAALVSMIALTAASEKISFTAVIARHAPLRAADEWGRRRSEPPAAPAAE